MLAEGLVKVIGTMPMSTLANFTGISLDHEALDRAVAAWRQQHAGDSRS